MLNHLPVRTALRRSAQSWSATPALFFSLLFVLLLAPSAAHADSPALSVGDRHVCAINNSGGAECWGSNGIGQLGNNSQTNSAVPVAVSGLSSGVTAVSAGGLHSCAVQNGAAKCWGDNEYGQLGDGNGGYNKKSLIPVPVAGLGSGVSAIAVYNDWSCAVKNGGIWCWGSDFEVGQFGPDALSPETPVAVVPEGSGIRAVSLGNAHACAINAAGGVICWGSNFYGQLGEDAGNEYCSYAGACAKTPVLAHGLASGVKEISAGEFHTCAVLESGDVMCWGSGDNGRLGTGNSAEARNPVAVQGLGGTASSVSAASEYSCAVVAGTVKCWGQGHNGQLGDGGSTSSPTPVTATRAGSGVLAVSGYYITSCALTAESVRCWGWNGAGQFGDGHTAGTQVNPVTPVGLGSGIDGGAGLLATTTDSTIQEANTCAVQDGAAKCWGSNVHGEVGDNTFTPAGVPHQVNGLETATSEITTGGNTSCAIQQVAGKGVASCWGWAGDGRLGNGSSYDASSPQGVTGMSAAGDGDVLAISTGWRSSCAIQIDAGAQMLKCWGANYGGELGWDTGSTPLSSGTPLGVKGMSDPDTDADVTAVSVGASADGGMACAVQAGALFCWGGNQNGELGVVADPVFAQRIPSKVKNMDADVTDVAVGDGTTCAIKDGALFCWGINDSNQVGDGTTTLRTAPVAIASLSEDVTAVSVSKARSCAVKGGALFCWGMGPLGDGTLNGSSTPKAITAFSSGVTDVAVSRRNICVIHNGAVRCIGGNTGDYDPLAPSQVQGLSPIDPASIIPGETPPDNGPGAGSGSGGSGGPNVAIALPKIVKAPKSLKLGKKLALSVSCAAGCKLTIVVKSGKKKLKIKGLKVVKVKAGAKKVTIKFSSKVTKQLKSVIKKNNKLKKKKRKKITLTITPQATTGGAKGKAKVVQLK